MKYIGLHQLSLKTNTLENSGKQRANKVTVTNNFSRHGGPLARGRHAMAHLAYRLIRPCISLADASWAYAEW